jgi:hypothetical protein
LRAAGKGGLDNINLFSVLTIAAFFLLAPVAVAVEGVRLTPAAVAALPPGVAVKGLLAGVAFHAYQQISYMILQRVSPISHSVGNCVKRVVVIVASVVAFNTPVSSQNAFGAPQRPGGGQRALALCPPPPHALSDSVRCRLGRDVQAPRWRCSASSSTRRPSGRATRRPRRRRRRERRVPRARVFFCCVIVLCWLPM